MTDTSDKSGLAGTVLDNLPTDKLTEVAETLLKKLASKALDAAVGQVEGLTSKLTDVAGNGGAGLGSALTGGLGGAASSLTSGVGDKVKGALGMSTDSEGDSDSGGGDSSGDGSGDDGAGGSEGGSGGSGGSGKFKFMNITESMDVAVPVRVAYDQWTQFADFPTFMKKVESVEQESDEKTNWKAQVMWSHRTWQATTVEQIPDTHIIWRSTGAKGHADGIVSFHELAPQLTRILLVLEYYPQGFIEKTANLWRAVGRRTRLEFKHFCRHLMMETILTPEEDRMGWRGEIRDSEVVKTHEEALEEEQAAQDEAEDDLDEDTDVDDAEMDDDLDDADEDDDLDDADVDLDDADVDAEDVDADDADDAEDEDAAPAASDTDGDAPSSDGEAPPDDEAPRRSRRSSTTAGSGRGRRSRQPASASA